MPRKIKVLFFDILTDDRNLRNTLEREVQGGVPYAKIYQDVFGERALLIGMDATQEFWFDNSLPDAVLIGGSAHDPSEKAKKPWIEHLEEVIRSVAAANIPMLGICGGHEFIADALGAIVEENEGKERELGAVPVTLTETGRDDFLFEGLPKTFLAMQSHGHSVLSIPDEWKILASSDMTKIQALAIGDYIRTTQFHPEFSARWLQRLIRLRNQSVPQEFVKDTRLTRIIFRNFLNHYFK